MQIKTKIASYHTADSKPVKREVNSTVILPPLVFPGKTDEKSFYDVATRRGGSVDSLESMEPLNKKRDYVIRHRSAGYQVEKRILSEARLCQAQLSQA